jgi:hypothetical protein
LRTRLESVKYVEHDHIDSQSHLVRTSNY